MKDPKNASSRVRWILAGVLAVAVSALCPQSFAQVMLSNNNATASITTSGPGAGMNNWTTDGVNPLQLQWFWYRTATMSQERSIDFISAPTITTTSARQKTISYFNGSYGVSVDYRLTGFSPGSGASHIDETISITNAGATTLQFAFFQYSDFNLGGSPGDHVDIGLDSFNKYNEALQTNGPIRLAESSVTPGADRAEAGIFPFTLNSLNDASITVLNNSTSAGPGDATWAFEWDLTLAPGGSMIISKIKDVQVPEPSTMALMVMGAVVCAVYRRRQSQVG